MSENDIVDPGEVRVYEIGYHLLSSIPEERVPAEVGAVKEILEKTNALLLAEEFPKLRQLTYMIRKRIADKYQRFTSAYFGWVKFECDAAAAQGIKEALAKLTSMLRFIIVKTVRESTLSTPRFAPFGRAEARVPRHEAKKSETSKVPISEAEIDKKLAELIAE
ncbi:MAG: Uncharacterized protein G01um101472_179 [Parcubacteria group bacterium Gr01-1014_72]|nr:MAG: Uncharacterized protein G01um101472_179 [Parcubacteria group bacterium Gr01-1014_72]